MWLTPNKHHGSLLCPSKRAAAEHGQIMARCSALKGSNPSGWAGPDEARQNFSKTQNTTWHRLDPVNLWDCDDLEARLDPEQCTWDDSWLQDFQQDFEETQSWMLSFWLKPTMQSMGMPSNFWFAVSLFSSLSPPLLLNFWNEVEPQLEPWMDTYTVTKDDGQTHAPRAAIWPTTKVDYAGSWTRFHAQLRRKFNGGFEFCGTLNALPLMCSDVKGGAAFDPGKFIEALEFTTEMLVSPIEVTTETMNKAKIQETYYREYRYFKRLTGPSIRESDQRSSALLVRALKVSQPYSAFEFSLESRVGTQCSLKEIPTWSQVLIYIHHIKGREVSVVDSVWVL